MTTSAQAPPALIAALFELARKEDRGALAALRRGLGREPWTVSALFPYVEPYLSGTPTRALEHASYLVAALFASHPAHWTRPEGDTRPTNLGASFARIPERTDSTEQRFRALIACHADDLPEHLRHAVSLMKAKEVPIDWAQLWRDIQRWDTDERWVQRRWARAFWGAQPRADEQGDDPQAAGGDFAEDEKEKE